ncbi:MAG: tryptophan 2,3-dioxygenase [Chloroherpetonaceae bacterium]|nr:tryptophan 2,3-dioxygenase [Chloroherpetonaceae bacterium]
MTKPYPPAYYADYLRLEQLLSAQQPRSAEFGKPAHDEMLFIIVHQAFELWFKQILHELESVCEMFESDFVDEKNLGVAVARLLRITEIQKVMIDQFRILETMTPLDFLEFRDFLSPASGFQSVQFRLIENRLGLLQEQRVDFGQVTYSHRLSPVHQRLVQEWEAKPSLFELVERWLERTPFLSFGDFDFWQSYRRAVSEMLQRDRHTILSNPTLSPAERARELETLQKTEASFLAILDESEYERLREQGLRRLSHRAAQAALLIMLYREQPILHQPFRLLNTLIEIDELFTTWRYQHAIMVQRMIGTKIGTGGSSGHQYLKKTIEAHRIFTDFFNLSTFLIPRSALPELPKEVERELGFYYGHH